LFDDTIGGIRSRKWKDRQYEETNNDLQHTTHKPEDWAIRTLLKPRENNSFSSGGFVLLYCILYNI